MPRLGSDDDLTLVPPVADSDQQSTLSASDYLSDSDTSSLRRQRRSKQVVRFISLVSSVLTALCAGSVAVFSLYAPKFQSRLHYNQFQINGVAIGSSLALYLPVSVMGYVCDRVGPAPLMGLSAVLFAAGYGGAAVIYKQVDYEYRVLGKGSQGASVPLMVLAFVCVGAGTCAMYISSVSTVAKNFGKGKYRGLALAMPITGFGLSGMWLSQVASHVLYETLPDGTRGDIDVFRFFVFLAVLLFSMGIIGIFTLRVVDEQDLIEEAIEELENSGLLDGSSLLGRSSERVGYGTAGDAADDEEAALLEPTKDEDDKWKKNFVLNAETRRFLTDSTMWPFALAFLFIVGPGEAFVNNLGTILGTLEPPPIQIMSSATSAATHVSVFGITSTIARVVIGSLTDILAPSPQTQTVQFGSQHLPQQRGFTVSRVVFMLFFALLMSVGLAFLASGAAQDHADRFWVVSGLVGAGYGAVFSLTPLIVTIIWGVENFATNFGIIASLPAVGSTFWGLLYSAGYQAGAANSGALDESGDDNFCFGQQCYARTFWAEAITVWLACGLLLWAWLGRGGWKQRGIVI
jgi:MFS family permease